MSRASPTRCERAARSGRPRVASGGQRGMHRLEIVGPGPPRSPVPRHGSRGGRALRREASRSPTSASRVERRCVAARGSPCSPASPRPSAEG
eukprot:1487859-Prymnesium_polylepis.2